MWRTRRMRSWPRRNCWKRSNSISKWQSSCFAERLPGENPSSACFGSAMILAGFPQPENFQIEVIMPTSASAPPTPERILQLAWGFAPPLVLESAIRHRIFDVLNEGPKTLQEIQAETGVSERGLSAIVNFLVGFDFLAKHGDGRFGLAPESAEFLVSTKPNFQGGMLRHVTSLLLPAWLEINDVVATGKPAVPVNQQGPGSEFFQELVNDIFPLSYSVAQQLAEHLELPASQAPVSVLDLAAGSGVWGIALAEGSRQVHLPGG